MISSLYVLYGTHDIFLSRDFKVLVADFALRSTLPVQVSLVGSMVKNPPSNAGEVGWIPETEGALEKEMATCSSSCLGNPMDAGAWWAAAHGLTESQTQLGE